MSIAWNDNLPIYRQLKDRVVSMMLDVTIRTASGGAKSYDDVLRYLYTEFFKKGKNYTPEDFQRTAEMMAGKSLDDFFSKYVRGEAEIDYTGIINGIGLQFNAKDTASNRAYIGADLVETDGRLTIRSIPANTPAFEQGLNSADQIIAIDGNRANLTFMNSYIGEKKPGDKIKLSIFRFDKLREITFTLGTDNRKTYDFTRVTEPTEEQKKLYKQYLNAEL